MSSPAKVPTLAHAPLVTLSLVYASAYAARTYAATDSVVVQLGYICQLASVLAFIYIVIQWRRSRTVAALAADAGAMGTGADASAAKKAAKVEAAKAARAAKKKNKGAGAGKAASAGCGGGDGGLDIEDLVPLKSLVPETMRMMKREGVTPYTNEERKSKLDELKELPGVPNFSAAVRRSGEILKRGQTTTFQANIGYARVCACV